MSSQTRISSKLIFKKFQADAELGLRVLKVLGTYFRETTSPGLLVYEEFIVADKPLDRNARREVSQEIERAHKLMLKLLPVKTLENREIRARGGWISLCRVIPADRVSRLRKIRKT